jgi:hypothetical protein
VQEIGERTTTMMPVTVRLLRFGFMMRARYMVVAMPSSIQSKMRKLMYQAMEVGLLREMTDMISER